MNHLEKLVDSIRKKYSQEEISTIVELLQNRKQKGNIAIHENLSRSEKLEIYMDLFKGRDDVYSTRWSREDKSGYSIACLNEWKKGVCNKTLGKKCANCDYRRNSPLLSETYSKHLLGKLIIGLYPLLEDDNCYFLAFDFDNKDYSKDIKKEVLIFVSICKKYNLDVLVERSRSGIGFHVWLFFDNKIPAEKARKLGSLLLSKACEECSNLLLKTYDRMFPSQDYLPKGGYGNLIALPFQKEAIDNNNSMFVDEEFNVISNQWLLLKNVRKTNENDVDALINKIDVNDDVLFSEKQPGRYSKNLEIVINNKINIKTTDLNSFTKYSLIKLACFSNPIFYKKQRLRLSTYNTPMFIDCSESSVDSIKLPRGLYNDLINLCDKNSIALNIKDNRTKGKRINVKFKKTLTHLQQDCINNVKPYTNGIIQMPTGSGKTIIGCKLINDKKVNTLIIVERINLAKQWENRIKEFLSLEKVGLLYSNVNTLTNIVDIASIKSLENSNIFNNYGMIIVDECHHLGAYTYEHIVDKINALYFYGLSATPKRDDGYSKVVEMQCGPIRYSVNNKIYNDNLGLSVIVSIKETVLNIPFELNDPQLYEIYNYISCDKVRNELIINDIKKEFEYNKNILVLTERLKHLDTLENELKKFTDRLYVYKGGLKKKEYIYNETNRIKNTNKIILSTSSYIGEGFDDSTLDTLFLLMPISGLNRIIQYSGRLLRKNDSKSKITIFDYVDINIKKSRNMFNKRKYIYEKLGYEIKYRN